MDTALSTLLFIKVTLEKVDSDNTFFLELFIQATRVLSIPQLSTVKSSVLLSLISTLLHANPQLLNSQTYLFKDPFHLQLL